MNNIKHYILPYSNYIIILCWVYNSISNNIMNYSLEYSRYGFTPLWVFKLTPKVYSKLYNRVIVIKVALIDKKTYYQIKIK